MGHPIHFQDIMSFFDNLSIIGFYRVSGIMTWLFEPTGKAHE